MKVKIVGDNREHTYVAKIHATTTVSLYLIKY